MANDPRLKTLMTGILLGESPRWHDGKLWFADWVAEKLYTLDAAGESEVVAKIASLPFSIDWLPDGRLLVVQCPREPADAAGGGWVVCDACRSQRAVGFRLQRDRG